MSETYRHIQLLGVELRNQIAAGEVVERPASAMKELVENSLDAGARQIDVRLDNGGRDLLRVQDDGQGIAGDELELAVTRHATSKISSLEELSSIHTLGFRGEALPSIASVSRLCIASAFDGYAHELQVNFGKSEPLVPSSLPKGTCVEVRELFGNTPARLKFLKSPSTELKRAQEMLERMALAHLDVGFSLSSGERQLRQFLPGESLRDRLSVIWPDEVVAAMQSFDWQDQGLGLHGLLSPPEKTQLRANHILLYVNGRPIQDKRLLAAVKEAYQGRLTSRDYPQIILFVEIDPHAVDVNVHPAKSEVRFAEERQLFASCVRVLREALDGLQKAVSVNVEVETAARQAFQPRPVGFWGKLDRDADHLPLFERPKPYQEPLPWDDVDASRSHQAVDEQHRPLTFVSEESAAKRSTPRESEYLCAPAEQEPLQESWQPPKERPSNQTKSGQSTSLPLLPGGLTYLGQIARTYLIFRTHDDKLLILDQHAAHERVLYSRLLRKAFAARGQLLMLPLEMGLHESERSRLEEIRQQLTDMGFALTISDQTLVVSATPPMLSFQASREFLHDALTGKSQDHTALLKSMACKAAIKAGHEMSFDEVAALLEQWFACPEREFCPHGRPTVLTWDQVFLEKAFKRRIS